jgi:hypothetical protein
MSEVDEKQAYQMFLHGLHKARSAAKQTFAMEKKGGWGAVIRGMDALEVSCMKLFHSKAQTRTQTLKLAATMQDRLDTDQPTVH